MSTVLTRSPRRSALPYNKETVSHQRTPGANKLAFREWEGAAFLLLDPAVPGSIPKIFSEEEMLDIAEVN